ncbi:MAG: hypothetical protein NZ528_13250 [Caldilineales bacterium]|nr:hypothetical protein [Caldilineales bacterium]MDW8318826.1 hypothetical protein [Anaerolineae bacterium]
MAVLAGVASPGLPALPAASAHTQAWAPLGFHVARGDAAHLEAAYRAGAEFAVVVFSWRDIQPTPDRVYWEAPDAAVRGAEFYGLRLLARLDQPPDWARTEGGPAPWRLDAYADFARRVAQRYGARLAGVILWNEPNLSLEWDGRPPDPVAYAALLRAAYPAVKAVAPDLPVLMAGLASTLGHGEAAMDDLAFLAGVYAAGGGAHFDALAAHPYGFGQPPDQLPAADRLNFRRLELLRGVMEANGDAAKPVWITEMGWRTRAPSSADAWQVVTPQQQADYTWKAIAWARQRYPWLAGIGLWELNGVADDYGYALWEGAGRATLAYDALVRRAGRRPDPASALPAQRAAIEILAPDVAIRLGDIGTLHPHWVHLQRGPRGARTEWQGEFFLSAAQAQRSYDLLLETMQVDQPTNRVLVNGREIGRLQTRGRPDATSTWATQRLRVPASALRPGVNTLRVEAGLRHPARQYADWRWENMQLRHVRLVAPLALSSPLAQGWTPLPSPGGWAEGHRLRRGPNDDLWFTANRSGQVWRDGGDGLRSEAANRTDLVFVDVLATPQAVLAATDRGLVWRPAGGGRWRPAEAAPSAYAYVVAQVGAAFYAGFEGHGLWQAQRPDGPWQPAALNRRTVHDIAAADGRLLLATDRGVYALDPRRPAAWERLPSFPDDATPRPGTVYRITVGRDGRWLAHSRDRLWRWEGGGWQPFGPDLPGRLFSVVDCCDLGALVGTSGRGVWRLGVEGWQRLDDGSLAGVDVHDLLRARGQLFASTGVGLFRSADGVRWKPVSGLPATVSDLLRAPADPSVWLAATPNGVYRRLAGSGDRAWRPVSPPWTAWDLALGPTGRLFVARSDGLAWADHSTAVEVAWQPAAGLEGVTFFSVAPHPLDPASVWAGTWGNNVAVSVDGGATVAPLHNGLETLSALDVLWHATPGQATIATIEGLYRTDDGGRSWFKLPGPLGHQTVYALLQTDDGVIWAGAADGLWLSRDYGASWEPAAGAPALTVLRLGRVEVGGRRLLWAGSEGMGLWLSDDGGLRWQFAGLAGRSVYALVADAADAADRLVAATDAGLWTAVIPSTR